MENLIKTLPLLDVDLAMATEADFIDVEAWNSDIPKGIFSPYTYWGLRKHLDIPETTLNILLNEYLPTYIGEALTMLKQDKGNAMLLKNLIILKEVTASVFPEMSNFLQEIIIEEKNFFQVVAWYGASYNQEITVVVDIREDITDQIRKEMGRQSIPSSTSFVISGA